MADYLTYSETPIQEFHNKLVEKAGVRVLVRREDLNHPTVSGNKWWKLKHNLMTAKNFGYDTILTFGGAFSNHIYATASAARILGLRSIGIIRGEELSRKNSTLTFAADNGMHLEFIPRSAYREKDSPEYIEDLRKRFGNIFVIPEGGTNDLAIRGCRELALELGSIAFDQLIVTVGTAGTITGLIAGTDPSKKIIGVPVLKNAGFLNLEISNLLPRYSTGPLPEWTLLLDYHFGGYGKVPHSLIEFINAIRKDHDLPLDAIYTSKMFYALLEQIKKGAFERGDTILAIHTGGLQGNAGFPLLE